MELNATFQCLVTQIPLRAEPKSSGEMVSQVIYGETYQIIDSVDNWSKIRTTFDQYEGWISNASIEIGSSGKDLKIQKKLFQEIFTENGKIMTTAGSLIPAFFVEENKSNMVEIANGFLNVPYLWGGRTFSGIDCSGLTQIIYKCLNISIPRDARDQQLCGKAISFEKIFLGDLVFFEKEGKIHHVGMSMGDGKIIHAHGKVKIDSLTKRGILNQEGILTHVFHSIKRINKAKQISQTN